MVGVLTSPHAKVIHIEKDGPQRGGGISCFGYIQCPPHNRWGPHPKQEIIFPSKRGLEIKRSV
jgi:hypothetical protein